MCQSRCSSDQSQFESPSKHRLSLTFTFDSALTEGIVYELRSFDQIRDYFRFLLTIFVFRVVFVNTSVMMEKIKEEHQGVVLQEADLRSESDIRSLTGAESCHQLLPEQKDLEMIQKQKSLQLLKQIKDISGDFKEETFEFVNEREGKLVYHMVVTGTTFGAHDQLMEEVKKEVQDQFDLVQSKDDKDYDVTIVFCPIVSRMGPDVESAMRDVKGDKPVILVLMHHAYEVKFIPNVKPLCDGADIQLLVNVFFHETKHGLLYCEENRAAACEIIKKITRVPFC